MGRGGGRDHVHTGSVSYAVVGKRRVKVGLFALCSVQLGSVKSYCSTINV